MNAHQARPEVGSQGSQIDFLVVASSGLLRMAALAMTQARKLWRFLLRVLQRLGQRPWARPASERVSPEREKVYLETEGADWLHLPRGPPSTLVLARRVSFLVPRNDARRSFLQPRPESGESESLCHDGKRTDRHSRVGLGPFAGLPGGAGACTARSCLVGLLGRVEPGSLAVTLTNAR